MIKFVPVSCEKLEEKYSSDSSYCGYVGYDLSADGGECGLCVFRPDGYTVDVLDLKVLNEDAETAEGFIRSALNYAANRGAYIAYYKAPQWIQTAELLGFKKDKNDVLCGEIPELLKGSCCKGK